MFALGLVAAGPAFGRAPAELCSPGRYLVEAPPLLGQPGDAGAMVTVTAGGDVAVEGICPPAPALRLRARRKATKVKAAWDACGELADVRLKMRVRSPACAEAKGVLRAKRTKRSRFRARRLAPCTDVEPSTAAIEDAVDASLVGLTDPWDDPDEFRVMITRIEAGLGCSFGWLEGRTGSGSAVAAARPPELEQYDPETSYCGKGTSRDTVDLTLRGDSDCLNHTCFEHDVCYFMSCVLGSCSWSPQSTACDEAMFARCEQPTAAGGCRHGVGWSLTDEAICTIARGVDALQDAVGRARCEEPACEEGMCDPETGTCETTTTSTTVSTTIVTSSTATVTSTSATSSSSSTTTSVTAPTTTTSTTVPTLGLRLGYEHGGDPPPATVCGEVSGPPFATTTVTVQEPGGGMQTTFVPILGSGLGFFATEVSEVGAFTVSVTLDGASTQGVVMVSDAPGTCPFENLPP